MQEWASCLQLHRMKGMFHNFHPCFYKLASTRKGDMFALPLLGLTSTVSTLHPHASALSSLQPDSQVSDVCCGLAPPTLDERRAVCFDRGVTIFSAAASHICRCLALSPEIFRLFCRTEREMNTKHLLLSCRDNSIQHCSRS